MASLIAAAREASLTAYLAVDYDAFGNRVSTEGVNGYGAGDFPIRWATKIEDEESRLSYYGFRYYDPRLGGWLNRDPIGERGGVNVYGFVWNDPLMLVDILGQDPLAPNSSSPWDGPGRCLRCAANDPQKEGEIDEPPLSKPGERPLDRYNINCGTMRKALIARGAYEPDYSEDEGCRCYKDGEFGYLAVFLVIKSSVLTGPNGFQSHFFRESSTSNDFYDNDRVVGDRDALQDELSGHKESLKDQISICPAICFPEGGIDVD